MPDGVRKRHMRAGGRLLSMCAAGMLGLNLITTHSFQQLPLTATALFAIAAMGNLWAVLADEGSLPLRPLSEGLNVLAVIFQAMLIVLSFMFTSEESETE